jgi:dTDP-glucose pyrophosphorylase
MWGIIPAAGAGSRIQPLAFSKELLPVGSQRDGAFERPRAVSEYIVERMILAGADKLCLVIAPGKSDIMDYYGGSIGGADIAYVVQPRPAGLCDAVFRALPFISEAEAVLIGLPDTIWFPETALASMPENECSLLLFPVAHPEMFDSVALASDGSVLRLEVKSAAPASEWIWGAMKMPATTLRRLCEIWQARECRDEYLGQLLNAYIQAGGAVRGVTAGTAYVDVGTLDGYRAALSILSDDAVTARLGMKSPAPIAPAGRRRRTPRIERSGVSR